MDVAANSLPSLPSLLPTFVALVVGAALLYGSDYLMLQRLRGGSGEKRFGRQIAMAGLTLVVVIVVVLVLPVSESTRGQLLSLLGLAVTAALTLSSATFVGNVMAGLMLRSVGNMRPGDYVRAGEHFGRVTVRGLFHTEIQTADRDLTTLPNLYLVSTPVTVVRESGTIVSCDVSLGYDNRHQDVDGPLLRAAGKAGLEDAFVHVTELGNFSVGYRVSGFLAEVRTLLSTRSDLRRHVLDELHAAGIEILSPTFMAQRVLAPESRVVPSDPVAEPPAETAVVTAEDIAFDKAEQAERKEKKKSELRELRSRIEELEKSPAESSGAGSPEAELESARARAQQLEHDLANEAAAPAA